jgi:hypothetical protein
MEMVENAVLSLGRAGPVIARSKHQSALNFGYAFFVCSAAVGTGVGDRWQIGIAIGWLPSSMRKRPLMGPRGIGSLGLTLRPPPSSAGGPPSLSASREREANRRLIAGSLGQQTD